MAQNSLTQQGQNGFLHRLIALKKKKYMLKSRRQMDYKNAVLGVASDHNFDSLYIPS